MGVRGKGRRLSRLAPVSTVETLGRRVERPKIGCCLKGFTRTARWIMIGQQASRCDEFRGQTFDVS
jgi:hypothetical protein